MSSWVVCQMGTSELDATTRAPLTQCVLPAALPEDASAYGKLPTYSALGVTALPAAASDSGAAEALIATDAAGLAGVIVGMRDLRVAGIVAELRPGESCLHAVDPAFESRVFCKDKIIALIIGNDTALILDGNTKTFTVAVGGAAFQLGQDGILMSSPDADYISMKDGEIKVVAPKVLLGQGGASGLSYRPCVVMETGPTPLPSLGVMCTASIPV